MDDLVSRRQRLMRELHRDGFAPEAIAEALAAPVAEVLDAVLPAESSADRDRW